MNSVLKQVLKTAEHWSSEEQADLAEYARIIEARRTGIYELDEDESIAILEGVRQADRGEFASDNLMQELAKRFAS